MCLLAHAVGDYSAGPPRAADPTADAMSVTQIALPADELAVLKRQLARQETVLEITRSFASAPTLDDLLLNGR